MSTGQPPLHGTEARGARQAEVTDSALPFPVMRDEVGGRGPSMPGREDSGGAEEQGSFFFFLSFFLGPHLWHLEIPRLGVESELQLPACTTATARPGPSEPRLQPTPQLVVTLDP